MPGVMTVLPVMAIGKLRQLQIISETRVLDHVQCLKPPNFCGYKCYQLVVLKVSMLLGTGMIDTLLKQVGTSDYRCWWLKMSLNASAGWSAQVFSTWSG